MKIGDTVYFDHQASTPVDSRVLAEMMPYLTEYFGNPHSVDHMVGLGASRAVEVAATRMAQLIGADPDEIIFTSGATESNNLALLGLGHRLASKRRNRILVSAIEHKSVLAIGRVLESQYGYVVEQIPVDSDGFVILDALEKALADDVLLVSIMAVNNEIGTIQDIREISRRVQDQGAIFHCDATQAPIAMDVGSISESVDILSLSSHKMYGPKGVGVAYIRRELQRDVEPLIYGGEQQNGLRSGTVPVPICVGMGKAAELLAGKDSEQRRHMLRHRRDDFVARLKALPWRLEVNGPAGEKRHPGNVNVQFVGFSANDILSSLQPHLAASTGSACTTGIPEPSHVLRAIGLDGEAAESSIRFSLGFDTNDRDVKDAVCLIEEVLAKLESVAEAE